MRPTRGTAIEGRASSTARTRRPAGRQLLASSIRSSLVLVVLVVAYAFAPMGSRPEGTVAVQLVLWLIVAFGVVAWQIVAVSRSPYPALRAVEAIAISVPLFVLLFASAYFATGRIDSTSFNEPLSRLDAAYFTVTVLSTVGFGDIIARTDAARMLVTAQMVADLVLVGLIAKVLFGAVQHRRSALSRETGEPVGPPPSR